MLSRLKSIFRNRLQGISRVNLEDWFYYWICAQNATERRSTTPRNTYYEFGVGWGRTLSAFARAAVKADKNGIVSLSDISVHAFDSFEGLPDKTSPADEHPDWHRGAFAYDEDYVRGKLKDTGFVMENISFHKGFFKDSLTKGLADALKSNPPSIVTIDVDYYSSTAQALTFLGPILKSGAVFYFDDLYSFHLHPDMGQIKAIREFQEDYGYLSELREYDCNGRTFMYSSKEWQG